MDKFCTQTPDFKFHLAYGCWRYSEDRAVNLYDIIKFGYMNEIISSDEGHLIIHFRYGRVGISCRSLGVVIADPKRAIALVIGSG